jgi:hypothetical protein
MQNYDNIDLWFTGQGDFFVEGGDLKDTSEDGLRSLIQDLTTISSSSLGDWKLVPGQGANVEEAIGKPNQEATAKLVHDRLRIAIVSQGIVAEEDLLITVLPVSRDELLVIERVRALPTPYNRLGQGYVLVVDLLYSHQERGTFVLNTSLRTIYD